MAHSRRSRSEQTTYGYLRYEYNSKDGGKNHLVLPLIRVSLKSDTDELSTIALVDSGSTDTLIPLELATLLSIEYTKGSNGSTLKVETTGAGGVFDCYRARIKHIGCVKEKHAFANLFGREILIPSRPDAIPYVILGRDTIFKKFDVTFSEKRHKLIFTKTGATES